MVQMEQTPIVQEKSHHQSRSVDAVPGTTAPTATIDEIALRKAYVAYSESGGKHGTWMTNAKFARMMNDCGVISRRGGLTKARVDILFAKTLRLAKSKRHEAWANGHGLSWAGFIATLRVVGACDNKQ